MHHPTYRLVTNTVLGTPVVDHWLEQEVNMLYVHAHTHTHTHTHTHSHTHTHTGRAG